jgi:hypothetical protein
LREKAPCGYREAGAADVEWPMPARNLPHVSRKFTRESAKLERQRKKEERRRRRRIDERPKQPEEIFKHGKT